MQLWILSIHCWALCPSWAQKLYTRLLVLSYNTTRENRDDGQGCFTALGKWPVTAASLLVHTTLGPPCFPSQSLYCGHLSRSHVNGRLRGGRRHSGKPSFASSAGAFSDDRGQEWLSLWPLPRTAPKQQRGGSPCARGAQRLAHTGELVLQRGPHGEPSVRGMASWPERALEHDFCSL